MKWMVRALVGAVIVIGLRSIVDIPSALIALSMVLALLYVKKLSEPYLILLAAIVGMALKTFI
jgi:chromate transporter